MKCLECNESAQLSGDIVSGIEIRICSIGHRTGQASPEMIKWSIVNKPKRVKEPKQKIDGKVYQYINIDEKKAVNQ